MGYRVRAVKSRHRAWKLLHCSRVGGARKETDIPTTMYHTLGFLPSMDIGEAKRHCSVINKDAERKRHAERAQSIMASREDRELSIDVKFPIHYLREFETLFIQNKKDASRFLTAKRLMANVQYEPQDWCYYKILFYHQFTENRYSYSHAQKLLYFINKWGSFICRKKGVFYEAIPNPSGIEKQKVVDRQKRHTTAIPISPAELEAHRSKLNLLHYHWLYLSIWLGLRPMEIDNLHNPETYRISYVGEVAIGWVYQSKLVGISWDNRWKPIPLKCPEQVYCLEIIKSKSFKRPLNKTIQGVFGPRRSGYSGRKGFTDLMLSRGHSLESVSQWLGHSTIERTWRSYKDKKQVLL